MTRTVAAPPRTPRFRRFADILGPHPTSAPEAASGPQHEVHATVTGTHGTGLRLERGLGQDRLAVLADGTAVTEVCETSGPKVGPHGTD